MRASLWPAASRIGAAGAASSGGVRAAGGAAAARPPGTLVPSNNESHSGVSRDLSELSAALRIKPTLAE